MAQYDRTAVWGKAPDLSASATDYVDITDQFIETLVRWAEYADWRDRTLARTTWWRRRDASLWVWRRDRVAMMLTGSH
jgi:hypothetical protein